MKALSELQDEIVSSIKTLMPELAECKKHGGKFSRDELKKWASKSPSVHVALPTFANIAKIGANTFDVEAKIVVVVCAKNSVVDDKKYNRADAALNMAGVIAMFVPSGLPHADLYPAEDVVGNNIHDSADVTTGIAMWGVHWTQKVRISLPLEEGTLPKAIYLGLAPEIGLEHKDFYRFVAGSQDE